MTQTVKIPLDAHRRIRATQARARDELEMAMIFEWNQRGNLAPDERQRAARPVINQLLGAYASKFFDLEAQEYVALKLKPPELIRLLDELAARVLLHMIPPQFRINSFFSLGDLHYDAAYRLHIQSAVEDCGAFWKKGLIRKRGGPGSPRAILDGYCERETLTIKEFAKLVRVDASVIYALKAGRKGKCGPEALVRIAMRVGCEPGELLSE
jgi:hypothetical protein